MTPKNSLSPADGILDGASVAASIFKQHRPDEAEPANRPLSVRRARPGERLLYALEERNAELELRLREWEATKQIYELEFRALEVGAHLQRGYSAHLESLVAERDFSRSVLDQELVGLRSELDRLRSEVAGLLGEIGRLRSESAGLSAMLSAVQSRRAYRLVNRLVPVVRKVLAPLLALRRLVRRRLTR